MSIIKAMKETQNHIFKKHFGQNFISDGNLLSAIVSDAGVENEDIVIEIGTGAGTLTTMIAKRAKKVVTFEIDKSLLPILEQKFADFHNINLVFADIMKVENADVLKYADNKPYKIIANLPYYITTPIIFKFLENSANLISMTIMVQKEVADRMVAKAGSEEYGALSAMLGYYANVTLTRNVNRKMFFPVPNVDSAVVRIDLKNGRETKLDAIYKKLVTAAFHMRRKTLVNNFSESFGITKEAASKLIEGAGFDPRVRGEKLSVADFIRLAKILSESRT